jgi:hypothetical protein
MGSARADHRGQIIRENISPLEREPGEVSRVVVKVDAVLAPRLTAIDDLERPATQRMEWVGNTKGLCLTVRGWCNRQLTPIRMRSASSAQSVANALIT